MWCEVKFSLVISFH